MSRARWVVFAYHTFGARALEALLARGEEVALVVTHADDPAEGDWFESVAGLARVHGVPAVAPRSPNTPEVVGLAGACRPDVILSVHYRRLLGPELLAIPKVAALNLHASLLPAYRGRAPINWALVNGERRTGVTLHHMTEEADAGDIVAQEAIDIEPDDTALALYRRVVEAGVELLVRAYPLVLAGVAPRIPQDPARATTYPRRRPEDGRVAWTWPAARIANMIRAVTHPYPGAFAGDGERRLHLWAGRVWDAPAGGAGAPTPGRAPGDTSTAPAGASPGTLLEIRRAEGIVVAAGQGALLLTRVQGAGAAEEDADRWAARRGLRPGQRVTESA